MSYSFHPLRLVSRFTIKRCS